MQLLMINGISSPVASMYSSNEPPNNLARPVLFIRPIRFRFGTLDLTNTFVAGAESLSRACRKYSAFESSLAIRDVQRMYSRIFVM